MTKFKARRLLTVEQYVYFEAKDLEEATNLTSASYMQWQNGKISDEEILDIKPIADNDLILKRKTVESEETRQFECFNSENNSRARCISGPSN